ncbi:hypothetical protein LguiA_020265 [Lonicera macranthoides]
MWKNSPIKSPPYSIAGITTIVRLRFISPCVSTMLSPPAPISHSRTPSDGMSYKRRCAYQRCFLFFSGKKIFKKENKVRN